MVAFLCAMAEKSPGETVKITDRRLFTSDGELRPDAAEHESARGAQQVPPTSSLQDRLPPDVAAFPSFVLSLSTTALVHLGEIADPSSGAREVNLEAAQQMIDILSMLQDKTRGNLAGDEQKLLEAVLYDLRIKFVQASRAETQRPR